LEDSRNIENYSRNSGQRTWPLAQLILLFPFLALPIPESLVIEHPTSCYVLLSDTWPTRLAWQLVVSEYHWCSSIVLGSGSESRVRTGRPDGVLRPLLGLRFLLCEFLGASIVVFHPPKRKNMTTPKEQRLVCFLAL